MTGGAAGDVHTCEPPEEGGHGFWRGRGGWRRRPEEGPTAPDFVAAPAVREEPEVADPDEAGREDVEEEAPEELWGREGMLFR